jgi:hypothetical protein
MHRYRLGCAAALLLALLPAALPAQHAAGDLALFDGDLFDYLSHVCAVVMDGDVVEEGCH